MKVVALRLGSMKKFSYSLTNALLSVKFKNHDFRLVAKLKYTWDEKTSTKNDLLNVGHSIFPYIKGDSQVKN